MRDGDRTRQRGSWRTGPFNHPFKGKLKGLLRSFANVYGALVLAPKRKEPMLFSTIEKIYSIPDGTRIGRHTRDGRQRLTRNTRAT